MNKQPIDAAIDADLRWSQRAIQRAAQRAWELAMKAGTAIVISRQGVIEYFTPSATASTRIPGMQEWAARDGDKR